VQVRKDLACVSKKGRPKLGYVAEELIRDIESFLGYDSLNDAIIVGAEGLEELFYPMRALKNMD